MDRYVPTPEAYFADDHPPILDEVTYQDIFKVINPANLPHRDYAPLIPSVNYKATEGNTMKFFVPNRLNGWFTYVRFLEWDEQVADRSLTAPEAARLLLWSGNVQLHCCCPAWKFWGSQYILTQLNAAIVPETRYPHIRNPSLKGIVCKHENRTLKTLPFHLGDMAAAINRQRKEG